MPISPGTIKFISSLRQKKVRQNYHKFTVEGPRIVNELLRQDRYRVDHVYALPEWADNASIPTDVPLTSVSNKELGRISQLTTPNSVLAVVDMPTEGPPLDSASVHSGWSLYLDGIQSPSNLGALLRIADWFGFSEVIAGPGTADLYNAKSIQASMGSFLRIDYRQASLAEVADEQLETPIFAADLQGESIYTFEPPTEGILVVGSEGKGVSEGAGSRVKTWLTIPRAPGRVAESLNVAVATGIICSALVRERGNNS